MTPEPKPLLRAENYGLVRADGVPVLQELSFTLGRGEILGVVGESGSGKSQLLLSLLGLAMPGARATGSVRYDGAELMGAREAQWCALRGRRIAMLFQDPLQSWNPYLTIGVQLLEVLQLHRHLTGHAARTAATEMLAAVGLPEATAHLTQYPHELSGGMRQRAMLAMAMLGEPELLLADEPTTALDATTQIAVLDLLARLRRERGLSVLLVTHDLGVVARVADRALVLESGRIVEQADVRTLLNAPVSACARGLLQAARVLESAPFEVAS
jgi:ABC-type glutathione transport system ATPase component